MYTLSATSIHTCPCVHIHVCKSTSTSAPECKYINTHTYTRISYTGTTYLIGMHAHIHLQKCTWSCMQTSTKAYPYTFPHVVHINTRMRVHVCTHTYTKCTGIHIYSESTSMVSVHSMLLPHFQNLKGVPIVSLPRFSEKEQQHERTLTPYQHHRAIFWHHAWCLPFSPTFFPCLSQCGCVCLSLKPTPHYGRWHAPHPSLQSIEISVFMEAVSSTYYRRCVVGWFVWTKGARGSTCP